MLKIDFLSIIVSDVTVMVGCSNVLHCCEVWCSQQGGWWRGRPTNRLDRHADWTDGLRPPHVASYSSFTLPRDETMPPCYDGGGEGGKTRRPVQQTICSHTDLQVDLLGRPVGGQATAHDMMAVREVWTEVRGSSLIISNASNRSSYAYPFRESITETRERERESISIIDFSIIV